MIQAVSRLAAHDMLSGNALNAWWLVTWIVRSLDGLERGWLTAFTTPVRILGSQPVHGSRLPESEAHRHGARDRRDRLGALARRGACAAWPTGRSSAAGASSPTRCSARRCTRITCTWPCRGWRSRPASRPSIAGSSGRCRVATAFNMYIFYGLERRLAADPRAPVDGRRSDGASRRSPTSCSSP